MDDLAIDCVVCRKPFLYTQKEQQFMEDLLRRQQISEVVAPKRCRECRALKARASVRHAPRQPIQVAKPEETNKEITPYQLQAVGIPVAIKAIHKDYPPNTFPLPPQDLPEHNRPIPRMDEDLHFVLVAGDFERLVCRQEVVLRHGNQKVTLILADIGISAMKDAMKKAVLAWWGA